MTGQWTVTRQCSVTRHWTVVRQWIVVTAGVLSLGPGVNYYLLLLCLTSPSPCPQSAPKFLPGYQNMNPPPHGVRVHIPPDTMGVWGVINHAFLLPLDTLGELSSPEVSRGKRKPWLIWPGVAHSSGLCYPLGLGVNYLLLLSLTSPSPWQPGMNLAD